LEVPVLRRLLLILVFVVGLTGPSLVAEHSAAASPRHVATRSERVVRSVTAAATVALTRPATGVATYWPGNADARVTLAFSSDGVHFGTPQSAGRDEMGEQRKNGTTYGALLSAPGAVAVRVSTDRPLKRLTVLGLSDGVTTTAQEPTPSSTSAAESTATTEPSIVSRGGWGADPAYMTWAPQFYTTKKLIVHHTATTDNYTDQAGAESQIRSIYYYHSVTQDWGDIGYNFLIDKFGTIYEGRYSRDYGGANPTGDDASGKGVTGAHVSGWNSGTVGVALLGTLTTHDATPAARDALTRLLAWEASRNGIDPQATEAFVNPVSGATITTPNIAGHRDYAATACPGDTFYPTLPALRRDVAALIAGNTPEPDTTPPSQPTDLAAVAGRNQVTLTWNAPAETNDVNNYQVWRSRSATTGFTQVGTPTNTTFTVGSLSRRTTYYFRVRAVDTSGNIGPFSTTVSARTS
jgi:N-acetylmuramoyl-L-alanine amidase-like protein/fibronectin type III domain protein